MTPYARHLLDPVIRRHSSISPAASLAVGIIVLWRSNELFIFLMPFIVIISIAFPFPIFIVNLLYFPDLPNDR